MAAAKKTVAAKKAPASKRVAVKAPVRKRTIPAPDPAPTTVGPGRVRLVKSVDEGIGQAASTYFANVEEKRGITFISSGAAIIDATIGGGYPLGRIVNIVGDKSAGKTLLAIEACANFHAQFPKDAIRYAESEAAFDEDYAEALGMPVKHIDFGDKEKPVRTVEDWSADVEAFIKKCAGKRGLYILDSFDALSDDAEAKREITEASFGASKAKKSGEMFRRLTARLEESKVLLIVVSQLRDKIGVTFGEKQTRSGGRALDFYASVIIWLAEIGKIKMTQNKIERVIGVKVKARVKKNKVGLPFRECEYPILFGYGIDDITASVEWLFSVGRSDMVRDEVDMSEAGYKKRIQNLRDRGGDGIREVRAKLTTIVKREWRIIEQGFLPKARKY